MFFHNKLQLIEEEEMEVVISSPLAELIRCNKCGVEYLETQDRCGNRSAEWREIRVRYREGGGSSVVTRKSVVFQ